MKYGADSPRPILDEKAWVQWLAPVLQLPAAITVWRQMIRRHVGDEGEEIAAGKARGKARGGGRSERTVG